MCALCCVVYYHSVCAACNYHCMRECSRSCEQRRGAIGLMRLGNGMALWGEMAGLGEDGGVCKAAVPYSV